MYRSILVPLDGSPFAEEALLLAVNVAQRAGAVLQVVMVIDGVSRFWSSGMKDQLATERRAYLDHVVERVRSHATIQVNSHLLEGDVATAIQEHAEGSDVDLVVMSTHGRGALGRFWVGSVADQLTHSLSIPLLLTRPGAVPPVLKPGPRHVLIPLDGGPIAEKILEHAIELGTLVDADYTLMRVVDVSPPYTNPVFEKLEWSMPSPELMHELRAVHQQIHDDAVNYLESVATRLRSRALRAHTRVVTRTDPGLAILETANPITFDLVAIESRGRRRDFLLGSVARKVVHGMSTLVLLQSAVTAVEDKANECAPT
ncbi:MAG TPA: universal stress protein [Pirellulales bacterium]|nr:universal stress protein [Pirellulales bacterium]